MTKNKLISSFVILFIICLTIIPCFALFTNKYFISTGHDNIFHFSQIYDLYHSIKNGNYSLISSSLNHGVGIGTRLMYGSLSHYLVVFIGFIIIPLGGDLMLSYKITILLAYLFSNIIMYKFAYYIFKNRALAILSVSIFALFPYRFSNVYIRNAFSETIVISILPLVFYGLVKWLKEDYALSSYIMSVTGIILVFHTHNISAVFTVLFVLIFLGVNYKKLINDLKENKKHRLSLLISIGAIIFICAPFLISLIDQGSVGIFRVFNNKIMGTDYKGVLNSYGSILSYFIYSFQSRWRVFLLFSLMGFLIPLVIYYIFEKTKNRNKIFIIAYTISSIVTSIILNSIFIIISFVLAFIFLYILINEKKTITNKKVNKTLLIILIINLVLLFVFPIWYILPSLFKKIQFAWRMWGFVAVFSSLLFPLLIKMLIKYNNLYLNYSVSIGIGLLIITSYPISIDDSYFDSYNTIEEKITKHPNASGWQLEYFPEVFFDKNYQSNSELFNEIKNNISLDKEVSYSPYIYDGKAVISNYNNSNIPNIVFDIETSTDTIIQLPLIYYKGYEISLINNDNCIKLMPYELDGLLTFKINQSGTIKVNYQGSTAYRIASYTQKLTFIVLFGMGICYLLKKNNCKKGNKPIQ